MQQQQQVYRCVILLFRAHTISSKPGHRHIKTRPWLPSAAHSDSSRSLVQTLLGSARGENKKELLLLFQALVVNRPLSRPLSAVLHYTMKIVTADVIILLVVLQSAVASSWVSRYSSISSGFINERGGKVT